MPDVVPEGQGWKALGRAVRRYRELRAEYADTQEWADAVGRSTRQVLGLERGERVGLKTLRSVERALGWPEGRADQILGGHNVWVTPSGEIHDIQASVSHVFAGGDLIGEISDWGDARSIIEDGEWKAFSDARVAELIEEAAVELQRRANARLLGRLNGEPESDLDVEPMAADRQDEQSVGGALRAAQDAAGEESQVEP